MKKTEYVYTVVRFAPGYEAHCVSTHRHYENAVSAAAIAWQSLVDKDIPMDGVEFKIQMNSYEQ